MRKILYYLEPSIEHNDPYFRFPTLRSIILPEIKSLLEYDNTLDIKVILGSSVYQKCLNENLDIQNIDFLIVNNDEIASIFDSYLDAALSWQKECYTDKQLDRIHEILQKLLKNFVPDVTITYESPNVFLKKLFPNSVHLSTMFGIFSRAPFPSMGIIDPCGIYDRSFVNLYKREILNTQINDSEKEILRILRRNAMHALASQISIKEELYTIKTEFNSSVLLAFQVDNHIAFNGCTHFKNHFEMTETILNSLSQSTAVIVTEHDYSRQLSQEQIDYLDSEYPNFVYFENNSNVPSVSQFILPYVDGLLTVSSSLAYQAALWRKPFFALGQSQVGIFACTESFDEFQKFIDNKEACDFDNVLYFLLSRLHVFHKFDIFDGQAYYNRLKLLLNEIKTNGISFNLFDLFMLSPAELKRKINEADRFWLLKKEIANKNIVPKPDVLIHAFTLNDAVSFDLFDTLAERDFLHPHELFLFIESDVRKYLRNKNFNFHYFRVEAEKDVRRPTRGDFEITIDQIYEKFQELTGVTAQEAEYIKYLEIKAELSLVQPKKFLIEKFNMAKLLCKVTTIITDIYLDEKTIIAILDKIGVHGYDKLLVSAETKTRKHNGSIYPDYLKWLNKKYTIFASKCLHVGDNDIADGQMAKMNGMNVYVKPKAIDNYKRSLIGSIMDRSIKESALSTSIINGLFANKFYGASFNYVDKTSIFQASPYKYGYQAFGPLIFGFIQKLYRTAKKNQVTDIYFLARDGWILKQVYDEYYKNHDDAPCSHYLYASRRATMVASIRTTDCIKEIASQSFNPRSLESFLDSRFGLQWTDDVEEAAKALKYSRNSIVSPYYEQRKLNSFLMHVSKLILENAEQERNSYIDYLEDAGFVECIKNKKPLLVDIGYSGSMQYYLKKILRIDVLDGYYFLTHHHARDSFKQDLFEGYLQDLDDHRSAYRHPLNDHVFIFESALSSPEGSLVKYEGIGDERKAVLLDAEEEKNRIRLLRKMHRGILDFCLDITSRFTSYRHHFEISPILASKIILSFADQPNGKDASMFRNIEVENIFGGGSVYLIADLDGIQSNNKELYYQNFIKQSKWKEGAKAYYSCLYPEKKVDTKSVDRPKENILVRDQTNRKRAKLLKNPYLFFADSKKCCLKYLKIFFNQKYMIGRFMTSMLRKTL